MTDKSLDPTVWGPHFWFFLMTLAVSYPLKANDVTKKKYYDVINNFPLFIPHPKIGNNFSNLLDKYPVSPYLEGKDSFLKWVHFIHNKINILLNKKEMSLPDALKKYRSNYKSKKVHLVEKINNKKHYIYAFLILVIILFIYRYSE